MRPRHLMIAVVGLALLATSPAGSGGEEYRRHRDQIETRRQQLRRQLNAAADGRSRGTVIAAARRYLLSAVADRLIPSWIGTPWEFSGTAAEPHSGSIACGFFVGTVLAHAGFRLDRIRFGELPAQTAIEGICPAEAVAIFRNHSTRAVLAHLAAGTDGLYLVGLDYHIGIVVKRSADLQFCHSTFLDPRAVLCEPAAGDNPLTSSRYVVVGELLTDVRLEAWLVGRPIAFDRSGRKRRPSTTAGEPASQRSLGGGIQQP